MSILQIAGLSKAYKRYLNQTDRLVEWLTFGRSTRHELNWVLRDISFKVRAGEAVGIIGANGAGKSTLLKLIVGTIIPTKGKVEITGKVAALLELGLGFHPDFTGRQNAYIAAQLMGYSTEEVSAQMPAIEEFAEIGDYFDQPIRTYSSGMQVRLAFSVATAFRPDILIVDEALSVGDAYFQHKSVARIRSLKEAGTMLLFVSHNPSTIKTLCDRAILIDKGLLLRDDNPESVMEYYNAIIAKQSADYKILENERAPDGQRRTFRYGNHKAIIEAVKLLDHEQQLAQAFVSNSVLNIIVKFRLLVAMPSITVGILIRDRLGNDVFGTNTYHLDTACPALSPDTAYQCIFELPSLRLGVGNYSLAVALHASESHVVENFDWWDHSAVFQILPANEPRRIGVCNLPINCTGIHKLADDAL